MTAGKAESILFQAVLQFFPHAGFLQGRFHDFIQLRLVTDTVGPRTVGDVVVDAHGKGIGFLEHHAHPLAENIGIHFPVYILAIQEDVARNLAAFHQVVHAVQGLE